MKGFYFDLVAPPRSQIRLRAALLLLGLASALAVGAYLQLQVRPQVAQQRALLQAEVARLGHGKTAAATMSARDLAQAWERAREASTELTIPWQALFAQLAEASRSGHVALMSIEPEAQKGSVALVAEARNMNAMLDFLKALQAGNTFSEVALQSHAINKAVPEKPVRFRVLATWRTAP